MGKFSNNPGCEPRRHGSGACRQRPLGCSNTPWVLPDRPPCVRVGVVTGLLGLRAVSPCGRKGLGNASGFAAVFGFYIKRKQIWLRKGSNGCQPPPPPQKAKWHQLEEVLCLVLLMAQISSEGSTPPLRQWQGLLRHRPKAVSAAPSLGTLPQPLRAPQCSAENSTCPFPAGTWGCTELPLLPTGWSRRGGREAHQGTGVFLTQENT